MFFQDGRRVAHETIFPGKRRTDVLSNKSFRKTQGNVHVIKAIILEKEVKGAKEMRIGEKWTLKYLYYISGIGEMNSKDRKKGKGREEQRLLCYLDT